MNIRIALLSSLFIAPCAFAMNKEKPEQPANSGWFRFSSDMVKDDEPKTTPQKPVVSSNWGWFRIFDHEEEQTITPAKAATAAVTASWLRTRDTNEE